MATTNARMAQLVGSVGDYSTNDIVLLSGEIGFEIQADGSIKGKVGDGVTPFSGLAYSLGEGVTLNTDQTIGGLKTIDNELQFLNQGDGTSLGRIFYVTFPDPLFVVGGLEPGSNAAVQGVRDDGTFQNLTIRGQEQKLHFGEKLIADYGGVAGRTWGSVNSDGTSFSGIRYTSVKNTGSGWYSLSFDDAAFGAEQSLTANVVSSALIAYSINVEFVSDSQIDVRIFDNTEVQVDAPFSFIRHFATEDYTEAPVNPTSI